MTTVSERDRLIKELKLAHQERMEASAKATNAESILLAQCRVIKSSGLISCGSKDARDLRGTAIIHLVEFKDAVEKLTVAQEAVFKLERQLLE